MRSLHVCPASLATVLWCLGGPWGCMAQPGHEAPPPNEAPSTASPQNGLDYWNAQCVACHGTYEGSSAISLGNANGDFRLDANAAVQEHGDNLSAYIDATMPFQAAPSCTGACAAGTADYIRSRQSSLTAPDCEDETQLAYGQRELKLLTSREYQNSLEDLLGVPAGYGDTVAHTDGSLGGFSNNRGKAVNGSTLDRYVRNAEAVATWCIANNKPFACSDPAACAQRFVSEFLPLVFRGPISDEQRNEYTSLFEDYPAEGLQLALEAALTSPYFLYRIEAGVDLQTALDRGYYTHSAASDGPDSTAAETRLASDFQGPQGRLEGDVWAFTENGGLDLTFSTPFSDPVTVEVQVRGSNYEQHWPELTLKVGDAEVVVQRIDHRDLRTYRFEVPGQAGENVVRLEFNNDAGLAPYGPGQDANLYIAQVSIVPHRTEPPPPPPDDASVLLGVDPEAQVLPPHEFASALSFMLTGSTPDAALLAAAAADRLTTQNQIKAQVERLIDSPRGREHLGDFVRQWFGLGGVLSASRPDVAEFTPEVKAAMVREVQEHFWHVVYDQGAPYSEFFDGDYTFLNRTLADFYGIPGDFSEQFKKTAVAGRGGPIASGAFMTANAHAERSAPILRAVHSRQAALCHYIDPPNSPIAGEDIDAQRAAAQARVEQREAEMGTLSSRDFYFLYTDGIDACAGCHEKIINPMFGLEDFDNVGRLRPSAGADAVRETIAGVQQVVSLQGTLFGVDSTSDPASIEYAGAKDFSNKIAHSEAVKACLVRRSFRFATGLTFHERDLDTSNQETLTEAQRRTYQCVASRMRDVLRDSGDNPRTMLVELATQSLVRLRR